MNNEFLLRHPGYTIRNPRRAWATRKAMNTYRDRIGGCEFAGCRSRHRHKPQVHHIHRIEDRPDLAASEANFICLCKHHHFGVGHGCSYHQAIGNVRDLCEQAVAK